MDSTGTGDTGFGGQTRCYRHPDRATSLRCSRCERPICPFCSHDSPVGQRCPECSRGGGAARVVTARSLSSNRASPAVVAIIALSAAVYLIQRQNPQFYEDFSHWTVAVEAGEWWRIITAAFLHSRDSVLHIVFNMYALYLFGPALERQLGAVSFLGLYLTSAAAGGALFQFLSEGAAVGASGAIFGLFGATLVGILPLRGTPGGAAHLRRLLVLLGINLALPLFASNIAWQAHIGGLAAGMAVMALWQRLPQGANVRLLRALVVYGLGALILLAVIAAA